jgi:hypothetical protein
MSTNVLIIAENPDDQFMLKPIIQKLMQEIGFQRAKIAIHDGPVRIRGFGDAMKWELLSEIIDDNQSVDVFLLMLDRDCDEKRRIKLTNIEKKAADKLDSLGSNKVFFAENAWQEIEVWVLAGQKDFSSDWQTVRADCHPKENYYYKYAKQRQLYDAPHQGRLRLSKEAAQNYPRIRQLCPEDVQSLENRIKEALC